MLKGVHTHIYALANTWKTKANMTKKQKDTTSQCTVPKSAQELKLGGLQEMARRLLHIFQLNKNLN